MGSSVREQIHRNLVAIVSLVVALTSLGYNTWRNEHTEYNRNQRQASFEVLAKLGELQELVFLRYYDQDLIAGNPRKGWALVLTIRDLSRVIDNPGGVDAERLHATWNDHWPGLESRSPASRDAILGSIERAREAILGTLRDLD